MKALINYIFESSFEKDIFYHGSNAEFDKFKLEYVNTGNKMQAFGYGIYITSDKDAARRYGTILYKVEVPKIGSKYIEGNKIYNKSFVKTIFNKLYTYILKNDSDLYKGSEREFWSELESIIDNYDGNQIYGTVSSYLGSDKDATEFFDKLGYYGIVFRDKDIINVVIFNTENINIVR